MMNKPAKPAPLLGGGWGGGRVSAERVTVVTGAGRGMGLEVARRLIDRGWTVVVTDIDETAAKSTATDLGNRCHSMQHDVRDPAAHRAVASYAASFGPVTAWINNAGILRTGTLWEQDDATMKTTLDINLLGVINGTRAALGLMRTHGQPADIVNMASMSAFGPLPGLAAYAASKAGVLSWTSTTAAELDAVGSLVRMHAVCPDGVRTDMVAENAGNTGSAMIFSGKLLDAGQVADAIVGLLGTNRIILSIPRHRAVAARLSGIAPRAALPLIRLTAALGERNRRKSQGT
jgi:NAD(P)-dependent dehydrogenase (short-subunit alcohol dehydrogenase family)